MKLKLIIFLFCFSNIACILFCDIKPLSFDRSESYENPKNELFYDNGKSSGVFSYGGIGPVVKFTNYKKIKLLGIKVLCLKKGTPEKNITISLLNNEYKLISRFFYNPEQIKKELQFVTFKISPIVLQGNFHVLFETNSSKGNGIYISYDNEKNTNSFIGNNKKILEWKKNFPKDNINWNIRALYNFTDQKVKVTQADNNNYNNLFSMDDLLNLAKTPVLLANWMAKNLSYESHYKTGIKRQSPNLTLMKKKGNCADFAILSCYVMQKKGYVSHILSIKDKDNEKKNHAVCAVFNKGKIYIIDLMNIAGPFADYLEAVKKINSNWNSFQLRLNIDNYLNYQRAPFTKINN